MRKPSVFVVVFTVFLDLIGFGIVIPLLPLYSREFDASYFLIGAMMGVYSLFQFLFAPIWGRLSDRVGRRPILLMSTAGSAVSYLIFGLGSMLGGATGLAILLVSRVLAGTFAANITVAQAYIADISPPEKRSQGMGYIGMAFGLGFIFGPALGGFTAQFGMATPGWVAAGLSGANFIFASIVLVESWTPSTSRPAVGRPAWTQIKETLREPRMALLVGLFFLVTFAFTSFETTLGLLGEDHFQFDKAQIGALFAFAGIIAAVIQGGLIQTLVRWLGEPRLIVGSLVVLALSLVMLPYVSSLTLLLVTVALLATGSATFRPPLFGLISTWTREEEQGATLGVAQSAGSLARVIGPIVAGSLYGIAHESPYLLSGAIALVGAFITLVWLPNSRAAEVASEPEPEKAQSGYPDG